jgi:hypothetical protein
MRGEGPSRAGRTDKKKIKFSSYKEIQSGAVAKSCMTNGLLIYGEYLRISSNDFATAPL